jgi:DNA-binding IclR family transcriptional regulator
MARSSPAVGRTVAVLNLFADHPTQAFTLTDIITTLRLSRATCHALLVALTDSNYLYRRVDKSYVIGPALVAIGKVAHDNFSPLEVARLEMRKLADEFEAIGTALFREKNDLVLRAQAGSVFHVGGLHPIGQRVSMMSPWGALYHAAANPEALDRWGPAIGIDPDSEQGAAIRDVTEAIQRRGYMFGVHDLMQAGGPTTKPFYEPSALTNFFVSELEPTKLYSLAFVMAPVRDAKGVAFLLNLSGFRQNLTGRQVDDMGRVLEAACRRISDFISGQPKS